MSVDLRYFLSFFSAVYTELTVARSDIHRRHFEGGERSAKPRQHDYRFAQGETNSNGTAPEEAQALRGTRTNAANSTPPGVYNVELEGFNGYWRARTSFQVFVDANN